MTSSNCIFGDEMLQQMRETFPFMQFKLSKKGAVNYQTSGGRWLACCIHGSQVATCNKDGCGKGSYCGCVGPMGGKVMTNRCATHGGASLCEHGNQKDFCKIAPCFGNQLCTTCKGQKSKCACGTGGHMCDCGCGKRRGLCASAIEKKEKGELPQRVTREFSDEANQNFANDEERNAYYDAIALRRIYENSKRDADTGCLIFDARKPDPRGRVLSISKLDGESSAPRIVYRIEIDALEDADWVEHTCDNVNCVEKTHLKRKKRNDDGPEYFERRSKEIFDAGERVGSCLLWRQQLDVNGYGRVKVNGETWSVHVAAYKFANDVETIPEGLHVCHTHSGNRNCYEPTHLYLGTPEENGQDRVDHGTSQAGENHYFAKLTNEQAREIFTFRDSKTSTQVSQIFNVSKNTVEGIWYRGSYYIATGEYEARARERQKERDMRKVIYAKGLNFTSEQYDNAVSRMMKSIVIDNVRGCWRVVDCISKSYPTISIGNRTRFCHRVMFEAKKNDKKLLSHDVLILHKCEERGYDHRKCINPDHLKSGTAKDNAIDRSLSDVDNIRKVKRIKRDVGNGMTPKQVAEKHGKSQSSVYSIINGVYYSYLSEAEESNDDDNEC